MKERIRTIMEQESLTPSLFADRLGIGRAVISHILNGRNNPSLEVITRILETFTNIESDWLLFGKGNMLKNNIQHEASKDFHINNPPMYKDLFDSAEDGNRENIKLDTSVVSPKEDSSKIEVLRADIKDIRTVKQKMITKIIIYFDDNSFQTFNPSNDNL